MEENSELELLTERLKSAIVEITDIAEKFALLEQKLQAPVDAVAKIIGSRPKDR